MKKPVEGQKIMKLVTRKLCFSTQGNSEITNLTNTVEKYLKGTNLNSGLLNVFIPGATGGLTTMEHEPGLVDDLRRTFEHIAPEETKYSHNLTHEDGNGHSHIRASLIGPSLSIPFENATLQLGKWQQIIFIDFDNRPREREIILKIIGEI
jgi:secondary thiamine-phosphate synthase enzyme